MAAVIQGVRHRMPDADLYAICRNPLDTEERHGIPAVPAYRFTRSHGSPHRETGELSPKAAGGIWRGMKERLKGHLKVLPGLYSALKVMYGIPGQALACVQELTSLARCFRSLKNTKLLIMAGSGYLSDHFDGVLNFPYTIFKWAILSRLRKVSIVFLSVGVGPLNSRLSRWLVRTALFLATYHSCRDLTSKALIAELGVRTEVPVFPDLACGLSIPRMKSPPPSDNLLIAVNAFPHCDDRYWPVSDPIAYQRYARELAHFAVWLLEAGHTVALFPTQIRADVPVTRDVATMVHQRIPSVCSDRLLFPAITSVDSLLSFLAGTDVVVATRFHAILLSFLVGKPVLALANHHKMADLMKAMSQDSYLFDIDIFRWQDLRERFLQLLSRQAEVRTQIARKIVAWRGALELQYDLVLRAGCPSPGSLAAAEIHLQPEIATQ